MNEWYFTLNLEHIPQKLENLWSLVANAYVYNDFEIINLIR